MAEAGSRAACSSPAGRERGPYLAACRACGVCPASCLLPGPRGPALLLRHRGVGPRVRAALLPRAPPPLPLHLSLCPLPSRHPPPIHHSLTIPIIPPLANTPIPIMLPPSLISPPCPPHSPCSFLLLPLHYPLFPLHYPSHYLLLLSPSPLSLQPPYSSLLLSHPCYTPRYLPTPGYTPGPQPSLSALPSWGFWFSPPGAREPIFVTGRY